MDYGHIIGVNKPVSRLVQGTVAMNAASREADFALLDAVYAEGCTAFDTAHVYGNGESERTLGRWINERGVRDQVVVITKGAHHNVDRPRVTPFDIEADLHDSFARFGFDYIDVYLLHRDDPSVPVGPIVEVLNEYHASGHIGVFGGSNWSYQRIAAANEYAHAHRLQPFTVSSPNFSLAEQVREPWPNCVSIAAESGAAGRSWYAAQHMPLLAWSSLAGGFFSGRFRPDNLETFSDYFDKVVVDAYCSAENFDRLERAEMLAEEYGVSSAQIALAYVLHQPLDVYALVGCRTVEEFRQNAAALALRLTPGEIAWLELKTPTA